MNDQYAGMGGSYVVNANGERELVERTLDHSEQSAANEPSPEGAQPATE